MGSRGGGGVGAGSGLPGLPGQLYFTSLFFPARLYLVSGGRNGGGGTGRRNRSTGRRKLDLMANSQGLPHILLKSAQLSLIYTKESATFSLFSRYQDQD